MKHYFCLLMLLLMTIVSCNGNKAGQAGNNDSDSVSADTVELELVSFSDSTKYASVSMDLYVPTKTSKANILMRDSLMAQLGHPVSYWKAVELKELDKDAKEFNDESGDDEIQMSDAETTLDKTYETPLMVVFTMNFSEYSAGAAHPSSGCNSFTFDKKTGRMIKNFLLPGSEKKLQKLLIKGLIQYFGEEEDGVDEQSIWDYLQLEDERHYIPLPASYLTPGKDGLTFTYGQYEIAAYAAGMPSFTIPYKDLAPYLTDEVKALIK